MEDNHSCFRISRAVGLSYAFKLKSFFIKSFAAELNLSFTSDGNVQSALDILSYKISSVAPLYGNYPDKIVKSKTPRAQISAGGPQYSVF